MTKKIALLVALIVVGTLILTACGSPECGLKVDKDGYLDIQVNPPGETGKGKLDGGLKRVTKISPGKKTVELSGTLTKVFSDSGNEYTIELLAEMDENDRLSSYELKITGGVYGNTPHTCSK